VGLGFICRESNVSDQRGSLLWNTEADFHRPSGNASHLPLAAGSEGNVDEAASVLLALVGAALGALGLLLLLDLGGLRLDLACSFEHSSATVFPFIDDIFEYTGY
jgi:hypothetical protein